MTKGPVLRTFAFYHGSSGAKITIVQEWHTGKGLDYLQRVEHNFANADAALAMAKEIMAEATL